MRYPATDIVDRSVAVSERLKAFNMKHKRKPIYKIKDFLGRRR